VNLELAYGSLQVEKHQTGQTKRRMPTKIGAEKVMAVLMNDWQSAKLDDDEEKPSSLGILTRKKMIYAANVSEDLAAGNAMRQV
jgi:ribosome-binding ATPase YchF (GTP1/OBG family)